jgi:hypothetical protein
MSKMLIQSDLVCPFISSHELAQGELLGSLNVRRPSSVVRRPSTLVR